MFVACPQFPAASLAFANSDPLRDSGEPVAYEDVAGRSVVADAVAVARNEIGGVRLERALTWLICRSPLTCSGPPQFADCTALLTEQRAPAAVSSAAIGGARPGGESAPCPLAANRAALLNA